MSDSPLAEIRSAELAAARSVAAETERGETALATARHEAVQLIERARDEGRDLADEHYTHSVDEAEALAAQIGAESHHRITVLREEVRPHLPQLAEAMLAIILPKET